MMYSKEESKGIYSYEGKSPNCTTEEVRSMRRRSRCVKREGAGKELPGRHNLPEYISMVDTVIM